MKTLKYNYIKVIQQNYGQGFEDVSEYITNSQGYPIGTTTIVDLGTKKGFITLLAYDLIEYRLLGYATRVVNRRVKNSVS